MAYKLTRYIINAGVKIVSAAVMLEVTLGRSNWRQEALLHHPAAGNVLGWCWAGLVLLPLQSRRDVVWPAAAVVS